MPVGVKESDLVNVLRNSDVAGLCSECDLQKMAAAVLKSLRHREVKYQADTCVSSACDGRLQPCFQKAQHAWVLDTHGLVRYKHTPRRCRRKSCEFKDQYIWGNFRAVGSALHWCCPANDLPQVIMMTKTFGVTRAWYKQFSRRLLFQYSSFWGEASVHRRLSKNGKHAISVDRFKGLATKAWFVTRMVERQWERGQSDFTFRLDRKAEDSIGEQFTYYYHGMRRRRLRRLRELDIDVTVAVVDGHQKLTRLVCRVLRVCVLPNPSLGLVTVIGCPEKPINGSCMCSKHAAMAGETASTFGPQGESLVQVRWTNSVGATWEDLVELWAAAPGQAKRRVPFSQLPPRELEKFQCRAIAQSIAEEEENGDRVREVAQDANDEATLKEVAEIRCTTHKMSARRGPELEQPAKKRTKRRARSGGFLVACTPDGVVIDAFEFMGSESCAQRWFFLARLKELFPQLKVVLHDDACHLRRFADNRSRLSAFAWELSYPQMCYILDRWHARNHVDAWCKENVHPGNDENAPLIQGRNSSRCEILFSWLRKYKHMFRTMGRWTSNVFVQELLEMHNEEHVYTSASSSKSKSTTSSTSSSSSSSSSSHNQSDS